MSKDNSWMKREQMIDKYTKSREHLREKIDSKTIAIAMKSPP